MFFLVCLYLRLLNFLFCFHPPASVVKQITHNFSIFKTINSLVVLLNMTLEKILKMYWYFFFLNEVVQSELYVFASMTRSVGQSSLCSVEEEKPLPS